MPILSSCASFRLVFVCPVLSSCSCCSLLPSPQSCMTSTTTTPQAPSSSKNSYNFSRQVEILFACTVRCHAMRLRSACRLQHTSAKFLLSPTWSRALAIYAEPGTVRSPAFLPRHEKFRCQAREETEGHIHEAEVHLMAWIILNTAL